MQLSDFALAAFTAFNLVRLCGYLPQMLAIIRDETGARAVSVWTWLMFAAANAATAIYSFVATNDAVLASVFSLNAVCCLVIVVLAARKKYAFSRTEDPSSSSSTPCARLEISRASAQPVRFRKMQ